jgi:glucosamine--fructose-6-phosphate aminotransferase (isomerizing)
MCGIVGYVGGEACAPLLVRALKRLEYRGYDSAGIATVHEGRLQVRKDVGKVDDVNGRLGLDSLPGTVGVAHTRWATHGAPTMLNAHPHTDCMGSIAIVHNGIIENFLALKKELQELNHVFT